MHVEDVTVGVLEVSHDAVIMGDKLAAPKPQRLVELYRVFVGRQHVQIHALYFGQGFQTREDLFHQHCRNP